jgi:two-component system alkaline phosphatase synthesis response regulator PhoP
MNILLIEDEKNLGETLKDFLSEFGFEICLATNIKEAKVLFADLTPQIILMDIGLPDGNGIELARYFRSLRKDFVLFFLSALNDPETRVEGLELGAEDYITKPFNLKELKLRLERTLKLQDNFKRNNEITFGNLKIFFSRFELEDAKGLFIPLSQKELQILEFLIQKKNEVVSRDEIIEKIWGEDSFPSTRTIDNFIVKFRKWAETDNLQKIKFQSVRGVGYRMEIKE